MESAADFKDKSYNANAELDELAIQILTLMNQYIACQTNIQNYIRSGCLDLAKARYINGNRTISSLQLPGEDAIGVVAKFRVQRLNSMDEFIQFRSIEHSEPAEESILSEFENISMKDKNPESKKRIMRFSKDPLKWFGFLVPQNLKQSKVTFEKCLEIIIECANIQTELLHRMENYKTKRKALDL